ncbi:MAG TPA: hypothetical protein VF529_11605 [Solirubrobacteraceae bacterium]
MRHTTLLATALLAVLAGCGGDERSPDEVAREYLTSDDPAKCEDADPAFLERQTRKEGDEAIEQCRRNVESGSPPKGVRYVNIAVAGDRATVRFEVSGQPVRVSLRHRGDRWLVTDLTQVTHSAP